MKVLYLDHRPRYEYRFLKTAILREKSLKAQIHLSSADEGWEHPASEGLPSVTPKKLIEVLRDPDQLKAYDVILWGDLHPDRLTAKRDLQKDIQKNLIRFVESGKGILFLCGPRYHHAGNPGLILSDLLPVDELTGGPLAKAKPRVVTQEDKNLQAKVRNLIENFSADTIQAREEAVSALIRIGKPAIPLVQKALQSDDPEIRFRARETLLGMPAERPDGDATQIRLTKIGKTHKACAAPDGTWGRAPKIRWWAGCRPEKDSKTLVETETGDPILIVKDRKKGRVAFVTTDEWWLWRYKRGDQDYWATYLAVLKWLYQR